MEDLAIDRFLDIVYDGGRLITNWKPGAPFISDSVLYWATDKHIIVIHPAHNAIETRIAAHAIVTQSAFKNAPVVVIDQPSPCCICLVNNIIGSWFDLGGKVLICSTCCDRMETTDIVATLTKKEDKGSLTFSNIVSPLDYSLRLTCTYGIDDSHIAVSEDGIIRGYAKKVYRGLEPGELSKLRNNQIVLGMGNAGAICVLCGRQPVVAPNMVCQFCIRINAKMWSKNNDHWILVPLLRSLLPNELVEIIVRLV